MSRSSELWPPGQEEVKAWFDAYVEISGLPLSPTYQRKQALWALRRLPSVITFDEFRAVLNGIKRHMQRGTGGYTETSLDWRNTVAKTDKMEELALMVRQSRLRRRGVKPATLAAQTHPLPAGGSVTVLAPEPPAERPKIDLAAATRAEIEKLRGDQS
jgi:hypothetical protein